MMGVLGWVGVGVERIAGRGVVEDLLSGVQGRDEGVAEGSEQ